VSLIEAGGRRKGRKTHQVVTTALSREVTSQRQLVKSGIAVCAGAHEPCRSLSVSLILTPPLAPFPPFRPSLAASTPQERTAQTHLECERFSAPQIVAAELVHGVVDE
jgi:hypothetical protein